MAISRRLPFNAEIGGRSPRRPVRARTAFPDGEIDNY
jgi:hypothetical protein